eukprot:TRINITY_DN781999_c0_g1_i1.p1 TRINITY_DN781999_c0_g1~~TRINITY_DN781999_c0_g1_i1.p1  ORF type:complete len:325 (-),score=99.96 TRINITY_DN781999_c0_g1_i1:179-1153(-)
MERQSTFSFGTFFLGISGLLCLILLTSGLHQISEGHVGVYWRGGAILEHTSQPGFHFKFPLLTTVREVQTTMQTDSVQNIPCGTSGGVMVNFDKIEVVNRLDADHVYKTVKDYTEDYDKTWIFDKIHHEINQFCSSHTLNEIYIELFDTLDESLAQALQKDCNTWDTGINIIAVRVTKPRIPRAIQQNFENMEAEKTRLMIAQAHQRVVEKESETEKKKATIAAAKQAEVSEILMKMEIAKKEAQATIAKIENTMHEERERSFADAEFYTATKEADANQHKLTPAFLEYQRLMSISKNSKIYFGEKIPNMYVQSEEKVAEVEEN